MVVESRGKASGRAPQSAEPSCAYKSAGGGPRGNPRRGFPLLFILALCTCAPIRWEVVVAPCCHSTPFLWCLPKETVSSRQRKALFYPGGSTIRVSASASVVFTHLRPTWGGGWWLTGRSSQLDAVGGDVGASSPWERRAGPNSCRGGTQKRVSLGLHPVSLRKSKEVGWNGQQGRGASAQENGAHAQSANEVPPCLCFVRVRRYVGRWFLACPAFRPHFFGACPKKRCRAAKEKRFFYLGGSTIRVSAAALWTGRFSPDLGRGRVRIWAKKDAPSGASFLFTWRISLSRG